MTACTLALQVVLTRLFSAVLPYHFSFLAISLALLGAGAGALVTYVRPDRFTGPTRALLARWCAVFSLLLVVAPFVFVRLDFSQPGVNASFVLHLAIACGLAGLLCFASGVVVALAIGRYSQRIGVVYAWDLVGAGIGISVSPRLTVDEDDPSVEVIDLHGRVTARVIGLVWHADRHRSAAAEAFVESAIEVCRELAAEPAAA